MTTVSGPVTDTQGNAVAGASVTVKYKRPIVGYDGGAVVQNVRQFTTDGSGNLSMAGLVPGHYEITIAIVANDNTSLTVLQNGTLTVQDTTTQALDNALDTNLEITANDVQRAEDAALAAEQSETNAAASEDRAQEWAENPEDDPVVPGSFSALHHAAKAEGWAQDAEATLSGAVWYITDDATSVTIGVGSAVTIADPGPGPYDTVTLEVA